MDPITIRYGETVTLPLDAGDVTKTAAEIFVGKPGQTYIIRKETTLVDGVGTFVLDPQQTSVPIGKYYYQVNTVDANGAVSKYPSPLEDCDGCDTSDFPTFYIGEALDSTEVS